MKTTLIAVSLMIVLATAGCGSAAGPTTDASGVLAPVPADYAGKTNPLGGAGAGPGGQVFRNNCVSCHGAQGHGDGPAGVALEPSPKNLAEFSKVAGDDYLFWRISTGRPGTAMPPWKGVLSDEQIWQVISFIRTLK